MAGRDLGALLTQCEEAAKGNETVARLVFAALTMRVAPRYVVDVADGLETIGGRAAALAIGKEDLSKADSLWRLLRQGRGLGDMAKKALETADKVSKKGKPGDEGEGRKMSVARYLYETVFVRKDVGTDEEIIEELREQPFCGAKFKEDDKSAKVQLNWYKGKFSRGEFPGAIPGKVYTVNQAFTSNKKKENADGDETPKPKRKPAKTTLTAAEQKAADKAEKKNGKKPKGKKKKDEDEDDDG